MSQQAQEVFKLIIRHNKLVGESELKMFLAETPDPEQCLQRMVACSFFSAEIGAKVLQVYRKKLEKVQAEGSAPAAASAAAAAPSAQAHAEAAKPAAAPPPPAAAATATVTATATAPAPAPTPAAAASPAPKASVPTIGGKVSLANLDLTPGKELVHKLLAAARDLGASDIHIKSGEPPVIRLASALTTLDCPKLTPQVCEDSLLSLLNDEQRKQFLDTNDLDFCYDSGTELGRFRSNFLRQHRGMDGVFRLISSRVPSFEELKLPDTVRKFTEYRQGIVLITGPKGCGKTTTLASLVDVINSTRAEHIITIEDPIEFVHPCKKGHVNQREVGAHTKSFSNALRAALREAPDVIMVGEMRDLETTSLAITAAETGHLVFATLHTPDAVRTLGRVLDVFPPKEQAQVRAMVSESLRGIVSQLLIPAKDGKSMALAVEIMVNTPAIGNLIRDNRTFQLRGVLQTGKKLGMMIMDESLVNLVKTGVIKKEDALSRAEDAKFMQRELAQIN